MPLYEVVALEKFVCRTGYIVQADSAEEAVRLCKSGKVSYYVKEVEEGNEDWIETVSVEKACDACARVAGNTTCDPASPAGV